MGLFEYYKQAVEKYAEFDGRLSRKGFWMFFLANLIIGILAGIISRAILSGHALSTLYSLILLIPSLAAGCRRLHDTGKSGWWQLIALVPVLGWIAILILLAMEGEKQDNQYGPVPKSEPVAATPPPSTPNTPPQS